MMNGRHPLDLPIRYSKALTFNRTVWVEVKLQCNEDRIGEEIIKKQVFQGSLKETGRRKNSS